MEGAVASVCGEILIAEVRQQPLPCGFEVTTCYFKRWRRTALMFARLEAGIEATAPAPLVNVGRDTSALADRANADVTVVDAPAALRVAKQATEEPEDCA